MARIKFSKTITGKAYDNLKGDVARKFFDKKKPYKKAGHRSWVAGNSPVPGGHSGDIMSPEKRSKLMSKIRSRNTGTERAIFSELRRRGVYFSRHVKDLPGRPDIVFRRARLAVFIDGDFWHGWRFPLWQHKLSENWRRKINTTRERDQRNFDKLRKDGWKVLRIWEHQVERSPEKCVELILKAKKRSHC